MKIKTMKYHYLSPKMVQITKIKIIVTCLGYGESNCCLSCNMVQNSIKYFSSLLWLTIYTYHKVPDIILLSLIIEK
jgi:hypothetical protein